MPLPADKLPDSATAQVPQSADPASPAQQSTEATVAARSCRPLAGTESKPVARPERRFQRFLLTAFVLVMGAEWVWIVMQRPDPLELSRDTLQTPGFRVDVNRAEWVDWMQLEGIGPTLAHRIVAERRVNGWFRSIDDVQRVPGIGPTTLDRIRPWLTISHEQATERSSVITERAADSELGSDQSGAVGQPDSIRALSGEGSPP